MSERWLQIKGDPSVRAFLFQQERVESAFDKRLDQVHDILKVLLTCKGVFHAKVHYASGQLSCWFYNEPYNYQVYMADEVLAMSFLEGLPDICFETRRPVIRSECLAPILAKFKRLRTKDETVYLRHASINRINGMIGMTFSCDGSHYIDYETFLAKSGKF